MNDEDPPVALIQETQPRRAESQPRRHRSRACAKLPARRRAGAAAGTAQRRRTSASTRIVCEFEPGGERSRVPAPSASANWRRSYGVVLVASLFERRAAGLYHNTAVVFDSRRLDRRQVPQDAHPRRSGLQREVLLHARATSASIRSTPRSADWACWCAGTSGIRKARA